MARKGPWPEGLSPAPWPPWVGPHEPHCPVNCTCPTYGTSGILSSDESSCLQESFRPVGPGERPEFNGAFRKADKHHPSLKCVCVPQWGLPSGPYVPFAHPNPWVLKGDAAQNPTTPWFPGDHRRRSLSLAPLLPAMAGTTAEKSPYYMSQGKSST